MSAITVKLQVPSVPNYIFHEPRVGKRQDGYVESPKEDIADLSDDQLREIAREWSVKLLMHAEQRRNLRRLEAPR